MVFQIDAASQQLTPMMRQYYDLKSQANDAILLFRMGDFYEIFGSDAEKVAPVLELVLTSRERGDQTRIPFCGVPHHSARNYWLKLLKKGYKVALADQMEDPSQAKGLVRREIVRVLTPGCVDDLDGLDQDTPNYLLALYEDPFSKSWAVLAADVSTGELRLGAVKGLSQIREVVERFKPREILARKFFHDELLQVLSTYQAEHQLLLGELPEAALRDQAQQRDLLSAIFGQVDLSSQPCGGVAGGEALVSGLMAYLQGLQASTSQFLSIKPLQDSGTMLLDESALRDLEIFETARRRRVEGSLYKELNQTVSPMGARSLRHELAHPLMDQEKIKARHKALRVFLELGELQLADLRSELKALPDLERLATRIFAGLATPTELHKTRLVFEKSQWILGKIIAGREQKFASSTLFLEIIEGLKQSVKPLAKLEGALIQVPAALGAGSEVFCTGFDSELDRFCELARSGEKQIEDYQEALRAKTGITSLKIKNHQSFGLMIEVTRANSSKVPADFIRRQTMVNNERFVTVELQELDETLASAQEKAIEREKVLYQGLLLDLLQYRTEIQSVVKALALFDLIQSFAWAALKGAWCEPEIAQDGIFLLEGSRHPVVEQYVGRHAFTPNDIMISPQKKHLLITGPNMAGKSTAMRQTAISAILAQIGSFVPAAKARIPIFDRIFTRVGAADDLSSGQSTFMVEMSEAANILRHATAKSLVILDEVGRGTSTHDGLAIAQAIFVDLVERISCYTMFATHYHELVPLTKDLTTVQIVQTEVLEQEGRIIFTHRLKPGASGSSYGIEVARIAGLPSSVIEAAQRHLKAIFVTLGELGLDELSSRQEPPAKLAEKSARSSAAASKAIIGAQAGPKPNQDSMKFGQSGFAPPIAERILRLDLNRLTPLQALNFIAEIQSSLSPVAQRSLFPEEIS